MVKILQNFISILYIYPPDLQKSDEGAHPKGKQTPEPASGDAKTLQFA